MWTVKAIGVVGALIPFLCVARASAWPWPTGPTVETEHGLVEGLSKRPHGLVGGHVDLFLGIPYAAPPTKGNRFRPPQPFNEPWSPKVRKATKLGAVCDQIDMTRGIHFGQEDCLFLNVYRPAGATQNSNLPVFVWIYGGAYVFGDGDEFGFYNGMNVVERHGHIVVTLNYRLFALGFLALPELAAENNGTAGNQGIQDQRAALQWVQRNIRAFGGDPTKVTLAGESAGAMSVGAHLVSPASDGLFHAAILESGGQKASYFWYPNQSEAFKYGEEFASNLGCSPQLDDRLKCLRNLPEGAVTTTVANWVRDWIPELLHNHGIKVPLPVDLPTIAPPGYPVTQWGPTIDGSPAGLPDAPMTLFEAGKFAKVPLIIGENKDDGSYLAWAVPLAYGSFPFLETDVKKHAKWLFTNNETNQNDWLKIYGNMTDDKGSDDTNIWRLLGIKHSHHAGFARSFRDSFFQCSTRDIATLVSRHGVPVYHYLFDFDYFGVLDKTFGVGISHAFEIPFVFRNHVELLADAFNLNHRKQWWEMADLMSCTWASFVRCQKPKCPSDPPPNCAETYQSAPEWTPFSLPDNKNYLELNLQPTMKKIPAVTKPFPNDEFAGDDRCDFWANVHFEWHDPHDFFKDHPGASASGVGHTLVV